MGKSEPSLVPGWLKNTGNLTRGGSSASSTSHSDVTSSNRRRNRTSNSISPFKSSSSNSCWVSGSGSGNHAYSSFTRSLPDVSREKDKERLSFTGHSDHNFEPLGNIISNRTEEETLRRSRSLVSRKKSELFPPRIALDSQNNVEGNYNSSYALHSKSVFDEDFPALGFEEKLVRSGLGPAAAGLNMAEALAQVPSRACPHPEIDEVTAKTQRLEELAIKQSRQLVPLTPVSTKALVPNSSDKSKRKAPTRTDETKAVAKNWHQLPSSTQQANRSFQTKPSDSPKSSHGKFHVLKPVWENGVSHAPKDATSRGSSSQLTLAPFAASTSPKSANHTDHSSVKSGLPTEKRLTQAQVKSRNDFFNLIKKKTSMSCSTTALPNSDPIISSPTTEMKSGEVAANEAVSYPASSVTVENIAEVTNNDDGDGQARRSTSVEEKTIFPDEEEAAFLRSLGWEENSGEDEGLTEEEISAFYQEYMSLKVCRGVLPKISMMSESHKAN